MDSDLFLAWTRTEGSLSPGVLDVVSYDDKSRISPMRSTLIALVLVLIVHDPSL